MTFHCTSTFSPSVWNFSVLLSWGSSIHFVRRRCSCTDQAAHRKQYFSEYTCIDYTCTHVKHVWSPITAVQPSIWCFRCWSFKDLPLKLFDESAIIALIKHHIESNNSSNTLGQNLELSFHHFSPDFNFCFNSLALSVLSSWLANHALSVMNWQLHFSVIALHLQLLDNLRVIDCLIDSIIDCATIVCATAGTLYFKTDM